MHTQPNSVTLGVGKTVQFSAPKWYLGHDRSFLGGLCC